MTSLRLCAAVCALLAASTARGAALQQVASFGNDASGLGMFVYVPDRVAVSPPLVVAMHDCGGSASAFFAGPGAGLVAGADQHGYILVFPETTSAANGTCWDVHSSASLTRDGGSDSAGIVSMVKYAVSRWGADARRVYAMGTSSGGMMTQVLLALYPDVFAAGSAWSGVPYGCWAGTTWWNDACAKGQISRTGREWGDLVRSASPGFAGLRPRIQLWHGDQDGTIDFKDLGESVKQWSDVLRWGGDPYSTEQDVPRRGDVRTRYTAGCGGRAEVEAVRVAGGTHALSVATSEVIAFFGLAEAGDPAPRSCTEGEGSTSSSGASGGSGSPPLRDFAEARRLYIGYALEPSLTGSGAYATVAGRQFDGVTPENAMKWDATEPSQGGFSWSGADQVVAFAQQHDQKVRGHTLVWHSQLPSWVSSLPPASVKAAMVNHVTTLAKRYAGKLYAWDVVNEILDENGALRTSPFSGAMGRDFVAEAFKAARAADPGAKLYINDYGVEGQNAKSNALYDLVKTLRAQGVPIDGVGFQSHFSVGALPSDYQANLQRFADLGVDVAITELDIAVPTPASSADLMKQASDYATVVNACLAVSRCVGITVWGVDDGHSWIPQFRSGWGAALLFDERYDAKPAFSAVMNALASGAPKDVTPPTAPANLAVTGKTATSVSLSWTASTDDVGVTGYDVDGGSFVVPGGTATRATISGLTPGLTYAFTVRARDLARNTSTTSNTVTVTTAPGADTTPPTRPGTPVAANVTDAGVTLAWTASTDDVGVAQYEVLQAASTGDLRVAATPGTSVSLAGLRPSTTYGFSVRALDAAGNASAVSGTVTVTTGARGTMHGTFGCGGKSGGGSALSLLLFSGLALVLRPSGAHRRPGR
jgi:endo-1,4-beta-xylanase